METLKKVSHTPGPWIISPQFEGEYLIQMETGIQVARVNEAFLSVHKSDFTPDELLANAKLLAAAPEMLQALRDIYELIHSGHVVVGALAHSRIKNAIAKATE